MFFRDINHNIKVGLTIPQYAKEIFSLIDNNRLYLKQWLSWIDSTTQVSNTKEFIKLQLLDFQNGLAVHETIFYKNKIVGVVGFNKIDTHKSVANIGYWLAKEFNNKGIMTNCVKDLIKLGFDYYEINKIEIRCAINNEKSKAIAKRLCFKQLNIIKKAELVNGVYLDHIVYELTKKDYLKWQKF